MNPQHLLIHVYQRLLRVVLRVLAASPSIWRTSASTRSSGELWRFFWAWQRATKPHRHCGQFRAVNARPEQIVAVQVRKAAGRITGDAADAFRRVPAAYPAKGLAFLAAIEEPLLRNPHEAPLPFSQIDRGPARIGVTRHRACHICAAGCRLACVGSSHWESLHF